MILDRILYTQTEFLAFSLNQEIIPEAKCRSQESESSPLTTSPFGLLYSLSTGLFRLKLHPEFFTPKLIGAIASSLKVY